MYHPLDMGHIGAKLDDHHDRKTYPEHQPMVITSEVRTEVVSLADTD